MAIRHRTSISGRIFDGFNYFFLFLFSITIIYPFWTIFLQSFSPTTAAFRLGLHVWLDTWSTEAWRYTFSNPRVATAYLNTIHRVVFGTLLTLLVTFTAAYALSKRTLPGRSFITILYVLTMFFGGGLIPTYLLVRSIGLMNTRWVLVIPGALNVFYVIIARNFLMTIDQALEDSALIDGAGYWRILFQIIVPLSKPVIATIALWTAVDQWNSWFDAMIYISSGGLKVLQIIIRDMMLQLNVGQDTLLAKMLENFPGLRQTPPQAFQAATILITIGPIVLLYPFIQRYFVKGVMLGSLKG
jgi:putative aldouronate transport system permease protein